MLIYAGLLLGLLLILSLVVTSRVPLRADLIRDRNALYRELSQDMIENVYSLRVTNMDTAAHEYRLSLDPGSGVSGLELRTDRPLMLQAESSAAFTVVIRSPRTAGRGGQDITLLLEAQDDPAISREVQGRYFLPAGDLR